MTLAIADNRARAVLFILLAIFFASSQDAIVKAMSGSYPVYETVTIRGLTCVPILGFWLLRHGGWRSLRTPSWQRVVVRALILCSGYFAFILSIASMPIANMVAIYFTMPFFVAGLARPLLGEHVPGYRWIAIVTGFIGVLIMVRPGFQAFEPASLLALYSAFAYAAGQMMGRQLARSVEPLAIANIQNTVYLGVAIIIGIAVQFTGVASEGNKTMAFLTRALVWPTLADFLVMIGIGVLSSFAMVCFINAYRLAESNFVAAFEYSGMFWAIIYGALFFHDFPDPWTWSGMAVVVGAGIYMLAKDRLQPQSG
jgi:drug/metabolite transporter (DMT)-like permease